MNWKRLLLAALGAYIVIQVTDFIFHAGILSETYRLLQERGIFRPEAQMAGYTWVMIVTVIVFSFFFALIFAKGYEGRGIMEGVRYAIYVGFLFYFVNSFQSFVIYPISYSLTWIWILAGFIQLIIAGIVMAAIYRPKAA